MTYEEYLNKLDELFLAQYISIGIFFKEIAPHIDNFFGMLSEKDMQKINLYYNSFYMYLDMYVKIVEDKLVKANLKKLSIKETVKIMEELVTLINQCVYLLEAIKEDIDQKLSTKEIFKTLTEGINHDFTAFENVEKLTKELKISYQTNGNVKFGLNLISDATEHQTDFAKVLISND